MRRRSGFGWFELIIGILLVVFGVYTLFHPGKIITGIVVLYGLIAVITGIADLVFFARGERYTGFGSVISLISGIFSIMAGIMLLVYPNAGKWIMILLLPIWFIAHGVSRLSHLHIIRYTAGNMYYYVTLIVNIFGIILGCMMIIWPSISLFSAGFLIGAYLILIGIDSIVMAISRIGSR
ncbi:MAG: HdeD family acid-resistance protein [Fusicatenibacter sp.]